MLKSDERGRAVIFWLVDCPAIQHGEKDLLWMPLKTTVGALDLAT